MELHLFFLKYERKNCHVVVSSNLSDGDVIKNKNNQDAMTELKNLRDLWNVLLGDVDEYS